MRKLVIEIDVDPSDLDDKDVEVFLREAKVAVAVNVEVGRPLPGAAGDEGVSRSFAISSEYFEARLVED